MYLLLCTIRGSDVNASLHYAARLVEAGDLPSLARRFDCDCVRGYWFSLT